MPSAAKFLACQESCLLAVGPQGGLGFVLPGRRLVGSVQVDLQTLAGENLGETGSDPAQETRPLLRVLHRLRLLTGGAACRRLPARHLCPRDAPEREYRNDTPGNARSEALHVRHSPAFARRSRCLRAKVRANR